MRVYALVLTCLCACVRRVTGLHTLVQAMCHAPLCTRVFLVLPSSAVRHIVVLTAAFPHTPYVYGYAPTADVLTSLLKGGVACGEGVEGLLPNDLLTQEAVCGARITLDRAVAAEALTRSPLGTAVSVDAPRATVAGAYVLFTLCVIMSVMCACVVNSAVAGALWCPGRRSSAQQRCRRAGSMRVRVCVFLPV